MEGTLKVLLCGRHGGQTVAAGIAVPLAVFGVGKVSRSIRFCRTNQDTFFAVSRYSIRDAIIISLGATTASYRARMLWRLAQTVDKIERAVFAVQPASIAQSKI